MEALLLGGLGGVLPSTGGWVGGGVTHLGHSSPRAPTSREPPAQVCSEGREETLGEPLPPQNCPGHAHQATQAGRQLLLEPGPGRTCPSRGCNKKGNTFHVDSFLASGKLPSAHILESWRCLILSPGCSRYWLCDLGQTTEPLCASERHQPGSSRQA